jgi:nitric oxide reductase subunit B
MPLSPRWRQAVILKMIFGFSLLIWVTAKIHAGAPPIPAQVVGSTGQVLFTGEEIKDGPEVFLKYGLMEHGTLWGHGAYLGPDHTAEHLHRLAEIGRDTLARMKYRKAFEDLGEGQGLEIGAVHRLRHPEAGIHRRT